jgi:transposase
MKAIHGAKAKNDRTDSHKIAALLRGALLPQAYVYPAALHSTRDLLRRRLHLVRKRGQQLAHIQNTRGHSKSSIVDSDTGFSRRGRRQIKSRDAMHD